MTPRTQKALELLNRTFAVIGAATVYALLAVAVTVGSWWWLFLDDFPAIVLGLVLPGVLAFFAAQAFLFWDRRN